MDRRTKILVGAFSAMAAYFVLSGVVYPNWIRPALTLDEVIEERRARMEKLEEHAEQVAEAAKRYREYLTRIGTTDVQRLETALRADLNRLIEKHGIESCKVSAGRKRQDRKTDLTRMFIDVTGEARLQGAIALMEDISELPYLLRLTSPKLAPAGYGRRGEQPDRVTLALPIEVLILPQHRVAGKVELDAVERPERVVRHAGREYSRIWERKPFIEQEPPKPLVVRASTRPIPPLMEGNPVQLMASATGGVGKLTHRWEPVDRIKSGVDTFNPEIDTSRPGAFTVTLSVTDERGESASDSVRIDVKPRLVSRPERTAEPPAPVVVRDPRWPNRNDLRLCMALVMDDGTARRDELMVYDTKVGETMYFGVGDEFDGGHLVFVHAHGALVVREDEYFVYPLGESLGHAMPAAEATDYPELQRVADMQQTLGKGEEVFEEEGPPAPDSGASATPRGQGGIKNGGTGQKAREGDGRAERSDAGQIVPGRMAPNRTSAEAGKESEAPAEKGDVRDRSRGGDRHPALKNQPPRHAVVPGNAGAKPGARGAAEKKPEKSNRPNLPP